MKRNYKSWAQSLIFVLIITLAVPFGMMGFAETTTELFASDVKIGTYEVVHQEDQAVISFAAANGFELDQVALVVNGAFQEVPTSTDAIIVPFGSDEMVSYQLDVTVKRLEITGYTLTAANEVNPNTKAGNHKFVLKDEFQSLEWYRNSHLVGTGTNFMLGELGNTKLDKEYFGLVYPVALYSGISSQNANAINYLLNEYKDTYSSEIHEAIKALASGNTLENNTSYDEAKLNGAAFIPFGANARIGIVMTAGPGQAGKKDFENMIFSLPIIGSESVISPVWELVSRTASISGAFNNPNYEDQNDNPGTPGDEEEIDDNPGTPGDEEEIDDNPGTPGDEEEIDDNPGTPGDEEEIDDNPGTPGDEEEIDDNPGTPGDEEEIDDSPDSANETNNETPADNQEVGQTNTSSNSGSSSSSQPSYTIETVVPDPIPLMEVATTVVPEVITEETLVVEAPEAQDDLVEVEENLTPLATVVPEKLPQTGENPPFAMYATGLLLIGMGFGLRKKY
jgi:LPXTG-motif cell wall-anchored protein